MGNCSGHLMSTSQVESVLVEHEAVAEAAVVAAPHKIKGECLYCFVTPKENVRIDTKVVSELKKMVRDEIAPFAQPDFIQEARILPKIAHDETEIGDISTLADESVVGILQEGHR